MNEQPRLFEIKFDEWSLTPAEVRRVLLELRVTAAKADGSLAWFESNRRAEVQRKRMPQFRQEVAEMLDSLRRLAETARSCLSNDCDALLPESVRGALLSIEELDDEAGGIRQLLVDSDLTPVSEETFHSTAITLIQSTRARADVIAPLYTLLADLDDDTERAAEQYCELLNFLTQNLDGWGSPTPDYHADVALDRVISRLERGKVVRKETLEGVIHKIEEAEVIRDLRHFSRAFAWNVWREYLATSDDEITEDHTNTPPNPEISDAERKRRFECMRQSLAELSPETRWLITGYSDGARQGIEKINYRRRLAQLLGVSSGQLAVRIYGIRQQLHTRRDKLLAQRED